MFNGYYSVVLWWISISYVCSTRLDVGLHHENSGYFIKPLFNGHDVFSLNKEEKPFVITQNSRAAAFEAQYGPFHVEKKIDDILLRNNFVNHSSFGNGMVLDDLEISAHLLLRTVTQERPILQVLFHASHYKDSHHTGYFSPISQSRFCMQIQIERGKEELKDVCILGGDKNVCLTEISIPLHWWVTDSQSRSVKVYYSVYNPDSNYECSYKSNENFETPSGLKKNLDRSKSDKKTYKAYSQTKRLISTVSLTQGQLSYQELKEDRDLLIYVPQKSFYPGSKFRVPVKLQIRSDLEKFVIRVRAKHGISVVGAEPSDPGRWQITMDFKAGERRGSVTARRSQAIFYRDRIQDVFDWIFQVDDTGHAGHEDDESGRIILILEYESGGKKTNGAYEPIENKVVAKVKIQHDNVYSIVPVIKTEEVINTAMITGLRQNFSMQIYSISRNGHIQDVTKQTTCHSGDEAVLKVSQTCNEVFLDGTESKGSPSVSIIAKYGLHNKFLFFRVWVPELPLELELSDPKLSQIKSWKVPPLQKSSVYHGPHIKVKPHQDMMSDEPEDDEDDGSCVLKYQQSIIEVYARFYIPDGQKRQLYLVHRKALFRVTDLVSKNLRVADQSVAMIIGNVAHGLNPGRTEIQVMSRLMRPIGAKEIKVANDKVSIKDLQVKVISDIDVDIVSKDEMPGTLAARIVTSSSLVRHYQEAFLDISVEFYDGTIMPLHLIPATDYFLDMDTINKSVVVFGPVFSVDTPQIIYTGPGSGEYLHLGLELGDKCQRRKSRAMTSIYVYVDCLPEKPATDWPNEQPQIIDVKVKTYGNDGDDYSNKENSIDGEMIDIERSTKSGPKTEAHSQKIANSRKMSHLEIGMYVLLGVFIVAILVFVVNCIVFMNRHHKKRGLGGVMGLSITKKDVVSNANDWVWIGRDTLERNAINTGCNQALMSEQDFTVNKNVARFLLPQSNPSSNRSSCATGNGGSNRNSIISTYKGSECSIRITPNPISNETNNVAEYATVPRQRHAPPPNCSGNAQHLCRPPLHTFHTPASSRTSPRKSTAPRCSYPNGYPALSDIQSTSAVSSSDERGSCSSLPSRWSSLRGGAPGTPGSAATYGSTHSHSRVPTPQQQARFAQVAAEMAQRGPLVEQKDLLAQAAAQIAEHEEDVANGNLTDSSVEWDYEAMGMTYEQLMEYFDNLKESTA